MKNLKVLFLFCVLSFLTLSSVSAQTGFDNRFTLIKEITFRAPENSNKPDYLNSFKKDNEDGFYRINSNITDNNFSKVSYRLIPGRKYVCKLIQINKVVSSDDCMKVYEYLNGHLIGAQGQASLFEAIGEIYLEGKTYFSFDKKQNLLKDSAGYHWVPNLFYYNI